MNAEEKLGLVIDGRFELTAVLGRGTGGCVYRAHQRAVDRDVAIKILPKSDALDPETRARFTAEAKAIAQLESPHTVALYDFGRLPEGEFYIVMELVEGRTLENQLEQEGPLSPTYCRETFKGISASLEEAHARGIIHRDIKPANIILQASDGRARVVDFGISKSLQQDLSWTQDGDLLGTPPYMAPELWSDGQGDVGPWTDLYALGVVLYEALTARLPFEADTAAQMMHAHLTVPPQPLPRELVERERFQFAIDKCLAKSPAERFSTAGSFSDALDAAPPRRRATTIVAASVALGVLIVAGTAATRNAATSDPAEVPEAPTPVLTPDARVTVAPEAPATPRKPPAHKRYTVTNTVGIDQLAGTRIADKSLPVLQRCARRGEQPETIRLMVSDSGGITRVRTQPSTPAFEACSLAALEKMTFVPPRGNFAVVTLQRRK